MTDFNQPQSRDDFEVAIICALSLEANAVLALFDDVWPSYGQALQDSNTYSTGRIGKHHIVLAHLPEMGKKAAATAASNLRSSFNNIRLCLVVGICGAVPGFGHQRIFLGDVVVSTGLVQFDLVRRYPDKSVRKRGRDEMLSRPPTHIRAFLQKLRIQVVHNRLEAGMYKHLRNLCSIGTFESSSYPGAGEDVLFLPAYRHKHHRSEDCNICIYCHSDADPVCEKAPSLSCVDLGCDISQQMLKRRSTSMSIKTLKQEGYYGQRPSIHFGSVASGDTVMKSGRDRDETARQEEVIAFEMEGAGVWDTLPTIVVKGACDYADSHKNKKWQKYATLGAAACTRAILKEWDATDRALRIHAVAGSTTPVVNQHFKIPRPLNRFFTGRDDIVDRICKALCSREDSSETFSRVFVIHGPGGFGKSEICIRVADLVRQEFWGIFWVDVSQHSAAEKDFTAISKNLQISTDSLDEARTVLSNTTKKWLLILDNADDPNTDYQVYLPSGTQGATIITSRVSECKQLGTLGSKTLDGLRTEDAVQLLLKAAQLPRDSWESQKNDAIKVIELLGSHTLAIIQAGAYIARGHRTLKQYPSEFARQRARLMKYKSTQMRSRYGDVYATFEASATVLEQAGTNVANDALQLLQILSMFDFQELPFEIFEEAWKGALKFRKAEPSPGNLCARHRGLILHLPGFMSAEEQEWDPFRLEEACHLLGSLSLVNQSPSSALSMHPLTHAWAKDRQEREQQHSSWTMAGSIIASSDWELWGFHKRLLRPHILSFSTSHVLQGPFSDPDNLLLPILYRYGCILQDIREDDRLTEFLSALLSALGLDPTVPSPKVLWIYQLSAVRNFQSGQPKQAIALLKRIISLQKSTSADDDHDLLISQYELGMAYLRNGQAQDAVQLLEHVVRLRHSLAETDPVRLKAQHQLARAYLQNDQVKESIKILEPLVHIRSETLPEEHSNRLASQRELAQAYSHNNQTQEAIKLLEQVVHIQSKTLPKESLERLASQHELARTYLHNNQIKEAIELLEQVVHIRSETLPESHSDQLTSQHELARAYLCNNQTVEGTELLRHVVHVESSILAEDDENRLVSQQLLTEAYLMGGQVKEANQLLRHILRVQASALSEDHAEWSSASQILEHAYQDAEHREKAVDLVRQIERVEANTLPEKHINRGWANVFLQCLDSENVDEK